MTNITCRHYLRFYDIVVFYSAAEDKIGVWCGACWDKKIRTIFHSINGLSVEIACPNEIKDIVVNIISIVNGRCALTTFMLWFIIYIVQTVRNRCKAYSLTEGVEAVGFRSHFPAYACDSIHLHPFNLTLRENIGVQLYLYTAGIEKRINGA